MNEEKIKEVFSDKDFVESLLELETAEEVQSAISKKGIDLSISDIEVLRAQLVNNGEELSEEDLENVAGGFVISATLVAIGSCCGALFSVGSLVNNVTNRRW